VAALVLAFAALPALADSMTPAAPTPASGVHSSAATPAAKTKVQKVHKTAQKKVPAQQQAKQPPASGSTSTNLNGNATVSH
jgi:hypothetical protein